MKLLITIPCCKNDCARAEQMIDLVYHLDGRVTKGHCLLVCAPDVHPEFRAKLKISASLAFESVELYDDIKIITLTKYEQTMEMLRQTAQHIVGNYTWPWLWLEPDCLPLVPDWREKLCAAYEGQPRRYLGLRMMSGGITFFSRTSIYPFNAMQDLNAAAELGIPFDQYVVNRSINCRLFQFLNVASADDSAKVRGDALLLHHDKRGVLLDWVMEKARRESDAMMPIMHLVPDGQVGKGGPLKQVKAFSDSPEAMQADSAKALFAGKRRGRSPKSQPVTQLQNGSEV